LHFPERAIFGFLRWDGSEFAESISQSVLFSPEKVGGF
jgi:hypothetical protein